MAFTVIPNSDIDPGSPLSTDLMTKLRDNDDFLFAQRAGLILVEKKLITADVQDFDFAGLDGDTDEVYRLVGRIVVTGLHKVTLQPNGISSAQASRFLQSAGGGTSADLLLANAQSSGGRLLTFDATFWAKKNPNSIAVDRILQSQYAMFTATTTETNSPGQSGGVWNETATNVTSLRIHSSVASGLRDGSTIALYKQRQS